MSFMKIYMEMFSRKEFITLSTVHLIAEEAKPAPTTIGGAGWMFAVAPGRSVGHRLSWP